MNNNDWLPLWLYYILMPSVMILGGLIIMLFLIPSLMWDWFSERKKRGEDKRGNKINI